MKLKLVHALVLLFLLTVTTILVGLMVRDFAMVLFLASLTAALMNPLNKKMLVLTKNRKTAAALITLSVLVAVVLVPLSAVTGMFIGEAVQISVKVRPVIDSFTAQNSSIESMIASIPNGDIILENKDEIIRKGGELVSSASMFLVNKLSALTFSGLQFLLMFVLYLYSLFFLIRDGSSLLNYAMVRLPLPENDKNRLLERFLSVTRATIKGTLLIGVIQGALAGAAMAFAGIESALFWSIIMMILSVVPVLGTILVWLPAAVILMVTGSLVPGILLLLWCGIVVGNIDNILRPKLVGQDTGLHELLILFSTLGGLALFGMAGFLVGPILAALWVTLWDMYGELFSSYLNKPGSVSSAPESAVIHAVSAPASVSKPIHSRREKDEPSGGNQHWLKKEFRRSKRR